LKDIESKGRAFQARIKAGRIRKAAKYFLIEMNIDYGEKYQDIEGQWGTYAGGG
jgi:hypothetical protein